MVQLRAAEGGSARRARSHNGARAGARHLQHVGELERAARRVAPESLAPLVIALARLDALAKGIGRGNPWDELAAVALALVGKPTRPLTVVPG